MGKEKLTNNKIKEIAFLRSVGNSYSEIQKKINCGYGTVHRYAKNVKVKKAYLSILKDKQKSSKKRSFEEWGKYQTEAKKILSVLDKKNKLCILLGIYWGEGTKKELNIMNGDPKLLYVFLRCIREIGVKDSEVDVALRLFDIRKKDECIKYWSKELNFPKNKIRIGEVVKGNNSDKLPFGMCRIRIKKGAKYFKLIMSMIKYVPKLF